MIDACQHMRLVSPALRCAKGVGYQRLRLVILPPHAAGIEAVREVAG